jgi:hypothetical protein
MSLVEVSDIERRIAAKIDNAVARQMVVSAEAGGVAFRSASEVMEFAKMMSLSGIAVRNHLREQPGACLAVTIQAIEWKMSPYAVANKSYSVNNQLAYESQLVQAVILQRAPIKGRFRYAFEGEGPMRRCTVSCNSTDGEEIAYTSPPVGKITPQNSPLWKSDPDQQLTYYSGRALCRRHFPDVLLGVYAEDEVIPMQETASAARDVTPLADRLAAIPTQQRSIAASVDAQIAGTDEDGVIEDVDTVEEGSNAQSALETAIEAVQKLGIRADITAYVNSVADSGMLDDEQFQEFRMAARAHAKAIKEKEHD